MWLFLAKSYRVRHGKLFFFKLAMTDRNMQARYFLKMDLKFWDLRHFASATSFHEMHTLTYLWSNLQTYKLLLWEKDFECNCATFLELKKCSSKSILRYLLVHFWNYLSSNKVALKPQNSLIAPSNVDCTYSHFRISAKA